jgi:hypothetical protein
MTSHRFRRSQLKMMLMLSQSTKEAQKGIKFLNQKKRRRRARKRRRTTALKKNPKPMKRTKSSIWMMKMRSSNS